MRFPAPTRADHQRFCEKEGWIAVRDARRRQGTHHLTDELNLPDGRVLRTRISHPPDRSTYGPKIWAHILRDQLCVSEPEFWDCVRGKSNPDRGRQTERRDGIPAALAYQLVAKFGIPEADVARMSKQEALDRLYELWSHE